MLYELSMLNSRVLYGLEVDARWIAVQDGSAGCSDLPCGRLEFDFTLTKFFMNLVKDLDSRVMIFEMDLYFPNDFLAFTIIKHISKYFENIVRKLLNLYRNIAISHLSYGNHQDRTLYR